MQSKTILVIAAHPDDEVLGCGGSMARFASEGNDVHVLFLGDGVSSRFAKSADAPPSALKERRTQAEQAATLLGVKSVTIHGLPDNRFDTVPLLEIVKVIEEQVQAVKPETVFTQHGGDLNVDHQRTFQATLTATRPLPGATVKRIFAYEVPSSTEWAFQKFAPAFRPNVFVDIGATLEKKIAAMALYEREIRAFPHPRSPEALRAHAQYWGSIAGLNAAEAFELIRDIQ